MSFNKGILTVISCIIFGMLSSFIYADETAELVVEGQPMVTRVKAPSHMENIDEIRSGWTFRIKETQALQMDDFENPGMIFVDKGLDLWNKVEGSKNKSCASCHSGVARSIAA